MDEFSDVWPYALEDKFGSAALELLSPGALRDFDETDCLRVALRLRLPVKLDDHLPVPIDVCAPNPSSSSDYKQFRIQTVREFFQKFDPVYFDGTPMEHFSFISKFANPTITTCTAAFPLASLLQLNVLCAK